MMTTNKRPLPASLTFNGASPLKKETFVTECLGSLNLEGGHRGEASQGKTGAQAQANFEAEEELLERETGAIPGGLQAKKGRRVCDDDFKRLIVLGTGSFAKVILVRSLVGQEKDKLYAMKVLDKKKIIQQKQTSHTMTERSVLGQTSSHPFIVSLKFAYQTAHSLNLVMDFCSGGELYYHLSRVGRFPENRARFYAAELVLALEHLHSFNVVYRDLKPENVLIASDGHIMLADFGLSKEGIRDCTRGTDTFCGTPEYLAPEVLRRCSHGLSVDWWSLGVMLYEMLFGLPPWYSKNRRKMFEGICSRELVFPEASTASPASKEFIVGLLVKDPRFRLGSNGVDKIRMHPFFATTDFDALLAKACPVPWKPDEGKIYFDSEYTRLPCETHPQRPTAQQPSGASAQEMAGPAGSANTSSKPLLSAEDLIATSPLFPSSLIERAFTGFSYTDPLAVSCSPSSPAISGSGGARAAMGPLPPQQQFSHQGRFVPPSPTSRASGAANVGTALSPRRDANANASKEQNGGNPLRGPSHSLGSETGAHQGAPGTLPHADHLDDDEGQFDLELDGEGMM